MIKVTLDDGDYDLLKDAIALKKLDIQRITKWELPLSNTTTAKLEIVGPVDELLAIEFFTVAMDIIVAARDKLMPATAIKGAQQ